MAMRLFVEFRPQQLLTTGCTFLEFTFAVSTNTLRYMSLNTDLSWRVLEQICLTVYHGLIKENTQ